MAVVFLLLGAILGGTYAAKPVFYRIYNIINPPDPTDEVDDMRRVYKVPPKDWYDETIKYYKEGYATNWANERGDLPFSEEMKDEKNTFGYLIRDLDGDGVEELMIGLIDDKPETRFTEIYIWHFDMGARRTWSTGDGHYMYLCEDNIVRCDSWKGSEVSEYMKYNGENNAMTYVQVSPEPTPQKIELTPFK